MAAGIQSMPAGAGVLITCCTRALVPVASGMLVSCAEASVFSFSGSNSAKKVTYCPW